MKTINFLSGALLLISSIAIGQTKNDPSLISLERGAKIEFEQDIYDFGKIQQGIPVTTKFKFKNTGNESLILNKPKGSCGCTTPNAPMEPVSPGVEEFITVKFNSKKLGQFRKSVTVPSNAGEDIILYIKGEVISKE